MAVETEELFAGEIMVVQLANADKLTAVEVNGQAVQYIVNGATNSISTCLKAAARALWCVCCRATAR